MDSVNESDICMAHVLSHANYHTQCIRELFSQSNINHAGAIRLLVRHFEKVETLRRIFEAFHFDDRSANNGECLCEIANALSLVYYRIGRLSSAENVLYHTWKWVIPDPQTIPGLSQIAVNRCRLAQINESMPFSVIATIALEFIEEWRDILEKHPANIGNHHYLSLYHVQLIETTRRVLLYSINKKTSNELNQYVQALANKWDGPSTDIIFFAQANTTKLSELGSLIKSSSLKFDDGKINQFIIEKKLSGILL